MFEAPTDSGLRGDYTRAGPDYAVDQVWPGYTPEEHDRWCRLYARQVEAVARHASPAFVRALLDIDCSRHIPKLQHISPRLKQASGWELVAVPGLVPNDVFFAHPANRRFPVTRWIREEAELDYLVEPDVFHDFFGHVPMLFQPRFADAMQAYGQRGLELAPRHHARLARLYWYLVEFGLERRPEGLKAFGAGILSSAAETVYAVSDLRPRRVLFDLDRVLRTRYRIDAFQQTYFVLDRFEDLLAAVDQSLDPALARVEGLPDIESDVRLPGERVHSLVSTKRLHLRAVTA